VIDGRRIAQLLELQDERKPTLVADIIALFFADSPQHLANLAAAIDAGDPERLANGAHRYLSSVENLGARRMRACCMTLEKIGRGNGVDGAQAALVALRAEFELAHAELAEILARPGPSAG
jgi:HPt (histidine-containing phosphotransfer) domain-containing protein